MTVTATAFGTAGAQLFGKAVGPGENGLGLTGNVNNPDNEITPGNFVQLDLLGLTVPPLTSINMSFATNSTTGIDAWQVFGTNTANCPTIAGCIAGATSLATGTDEGVHTLVGVLGSTGFRFLDVTATAGDILINELDNNINVPLPGAIWMFGAGLGGLGLLMRRRKNEGQLQPV
jgi:hypothetical protein